MQTDHVFSLIAEEARRQQETLMLIPSENYASKAVREAVGSILCNKYSEGYAGKRYYEGNEVVDQIEQLAIERAKQVFDVPYANVQPYSGSPANAEILFALCNPGDTIMGLALPSGGHLTHGHPKVTFSGKFFKSVQFGLGSDGRIDYASMESVALEHKPKVIILGTTAYPFFIDWERARTIADKVGAFLVADISHIAGLIIAGVHPSPAPFAHVIMTTTHKTLRGPRGAMILVTSEGIGKDAKLPSRIDAAIIPGFQGGPHNNVTAGIAVCLAEAMTPEYLQYGKQVVANAHVLAQSLQKHGISLVGGGTENHLMVLDFSKDADGKGTLVARAMNAAGIVANRNTVPNDKSPFYPSGVRLGTPAVTTRGMKEHEMEMIASWIAKIANHVGNDGLPSEKTERASFLAAFTLQVQADPVLVAIKDEVATLCRQFPV